MQNKAKETGEAMANAILAAQAVKDDTESSIEKKLTFGKNKFYDLFKGRFFRSGLHNSSGYNTDYAD